MSDLDELRIYCLMRTDIEIPIGKMMAQSGHAFASIVNINMLQNNSNITYYMNHDQPKIVLKCKNLHYLERAKQECDDKKICNALIIDAGRTVFKEPTVTCLGIGPISFNNLPKFIQRMQLF